MTVFVLVDQIWRVKDDSVCACRPDMEEAKEVHKCLRSAAGIFTYVKVW
jgi:hypothetical protein